jgi:hypothetical protein
MLLVEEIAVLKTTPPRDSFWATLTQPFMIPYMQYSYFVYV